MAKRRPVPPLTSSAAGTFPARPQRSVVRIDPRNYFSAEDVRKAKAAQRAPLTGPGPGISETAGLPKRKRRSPQAIQAASRVLRGR
jgi:hypothetical protein